MSIRLIRIIVIIDISTILINHCYHIFTSNTYIQIYFIEIEFRGQSAAIDIDVGKWYCESLPKNMYICCVFELSALSPCFVEQKPTKIVQKHIFYCISFVL